MDNQTKRFIIILLCIVALIYLGFAFITLSFDFRLWREDERGLFVFVALSAFPLTAAIMAAINFKR